MKCLAARLPVIALVLFIGLSLTACGGGASSTPGGGADSVVVSLSQSGSTTTANAGSSPITLTASVTNDTSNAGVTWSLSPATGCGTLTSSGTTATYTTPAESLLVANCTATVTSTSAANSAKTATLVFTIKPVSITIPAGQSATQAATAGVSSLPFSASIADDASGSATLNWSITGSAAGVAQPARKRAALSTGLLNSPTSSCGSLSSSTGNSVTFTPPVGIACTATVTVATSINANVAKTFTINVALPIVTASVTAANKVYDGTNTADITACTLAGVLSADTGNVTCAATGIFSSVSVGTGKTVTASGIILGGTAASGYTLASATATTTADITTRALTVTAETATKTYDGTNSSSGTPTITTGTLATGDSASWTQTYDNKDVGAAHLLTPAGTVTGVNGSSNYSVTFVPVNTGTITAKAVTVTAAASTKSYDGTTSSSGTPTITAGSLVTGDTAAWTQSYDNINIGVAHVLTPAGTVSDGNGGANYSPTFAAINSGVITAKPLTASVTASDKVYDGGSVAIINGCTLTGVLAAEASNVNCSAGAGTFSDANAGAGKTVSATSITLGGTAAGNYSLPVTTATATATISAKALTVTATTGTKTYDGTTSSSGIPTITAGSLSGTDTATWTQAYDNKNVGTAHVLTPAGTMSDGNNGGNYIVTFATVNTGAITTRALTVTAGASTKTYDGTASSSGTPTITSGSLAVGDTAAWAQTYDNKNVGVAHVVTPVGTVSDGNGGNNYNATLASIASGVITAKPLTASVTASDKVYDGGSVASINGCTLTGVLAAEASNVNCSVAAGAFSNANAGGGKTVTATGIALGGTAAGNYTLPLTTATTTATISTRALTVTATSGTKTYDGTISSGSVPTITAGSLAGTDTAAWTQTYDNRNVGLRVLTPAGTVSDGNGGNNYTVNFAPVNTGAITARTLTVTAVANTKTYDTTTSSLNIPTITAGSVVAGDTAVLVQTYDNKNAGTTHVLTPSATLTDGNGGNNYSVAYVPFNTGVITEKSVTASVTASNKIFDGSNTASITGCTRSGVLNLDIVSCSWLAATFSDANAGTGKTVTATGISLGGADAANYQLSSTIATTTASITGKALTVTAVASSKTYDGNTSSSGVPTITSGNLVGSDAATWTQTFDNKNVGNAHVLTPAGAVNDGNGGNNYNVNFVTYNSGVITAKGLTVTGLSAYDKVYDGTIVATLTGTASLSGVISGDMVTLSGTPYGSFATQQVIVPNQVTVRGLALSGADAGNYTLPLFFWLPANILKKTLIAAADDKIMATLAPLPLLTYSYSGFVGGEGPSALTGAPILSTTATPLSPIGSYPITIAQGSLQANNYAFALQDGTLTITQSIVVELSPETAQYMDAGQTLQIAPTVFNDAATLGVNFSLTPSTGCGTLSANTALSGTPVTYSVPAANGGCLATVIATSVSDNTKSASVNINVAPALGLPPPGPITAIIGQNFCCWQVQAVGGWPVYSFTVNGTAFTPAGLFLGNGSLLLQRSGNDGLLLSGVPTSPGTVPISVTVTDGTGATYGPIEYSVVITGPGHRISGQVMGNNGPGGIPPVTVSINTTPVQTTTTDPDGNFSFQGIQDGNYTITPSLTGEGLNAMFLPATRDVIVNNSDQFVNFQATLGYTVSGTVSYTGSKTGTIYIALQSNNNCNGTSFGTSIPATALATGGNFTIKGVCPGDYSLKAWMDTIGLGVPNGTNASGSTSGVAVPTGSNPQVVLADQTDDFGGLNGPQVNISPMSGGVVLQVKPVTADPNNDGVELPPQYGVQWSDDNFVTSNETIVVATGGDQPYMLSSRTGLSGLSDSSVLTFRVRGESKDRSMTTLWTTTPTVTIGAVTPTNPVTVQGSVNSSAAATTGPLYVGCFDEDTGTLYGQSFAGGGSFPQPYSINVTSGTSCFMFGIVDNNHNSVIDTGDASNTDGNGSSSLLVTAPGPLTKNIDLPGSKSVVSLTTSHFKSFDIGSNNENFSLNFDLRGGLKLPVAMQIASGPNVLAPVDVAPQQSKKGGRFQSWSSVGNARPLPSDTYGLSVTYSDGDSETVNATVATVLDSFAQNLSVNTTTGGATITTPTFNWSAPSNPPAGGYTYQFRLDGQNGTIWQVPGNNSKVNGLPSTTTSLVWGVDPTDGNNVPSLSTLPSGTYHWTVTVQDSDGNSAQAQVTFTADSLPTTVDWALLVWPSNLHFVIGSAFVDAVYGQAYQQNMPNYYPDHLADLNLVGQVGYGPIGSDPTDNSNWHWAPMAFNVWKPGTIPEYVSSLNPSDMPGVGEYNMAVRFSIQGGPWLYGDLDDSNNGFNTPGRLSVTN